MRNYIEPTWNMQCNGIHYETVSKRLLSVNYNM